MGNLLPAETTPDSILPCQLGDRLFGATRLQPEKRLQLAVLEDAVLTFHRCAGAETTRARNLLNEVRTWTSSEDASGARCLPSGSPPARSRSRARARSRAEHSSH